MTEGTLEWSRVEELFPTLVELAVAQREAFLACHCAGAPALRRELESLLAATTAPITIDQPPTLAPGVRAIPPTAGLAEGERLGGWRVLRLIGRGGMGEVYLAERADGAYDAAAAIKLLRADAVDQDARFDAERRILAQLRHPHIARLLDGGVTAAGRPYMVMEYVVGEPLDRHCRTQALGLPERLALFGQVCAAVAYAHAHLVIHRDLKPGNVLVDDTGQVKLLDFGIARLIDDSGAAGEATQTAPLTPDHAAPEQLRGDPVTTAVDVYSLGMLLHELLAGQRPWSGHATVLSRAVKKLLSEDPPLASETAAENPQAPVAPQKLRGDLDAVVAQCLRREPAQRYPTVDALLLDLGRIREHRPVAARGTVFGYVFRRWLRRHRVPVAAGVIVLIALLAGIGVALWQARRAQAEALRAERVKEFLVGVFEQADPDRARGATVSARDLLDRGAREVPSRLAGEPLVQADLDHALARIYASLGAYPRAAELAQASVDLRRRALAPDDPLIAAPLMTLGDSLIETGDQERAHEALTESARIFLAAQGPDSLDLAKVKGSLGTSEQWLNHRDQAVQLNREAYETYLRKLGPGHEDTAHAALALGQAYEVAGQYDDAERLYRVALRDFRASVGEEHSATGLAHLDLGGLLDRVGRPEDGDLELQAAIAILRKVYGPDHPQVGAALFSRGILLMGLRRYDDADAAFRETLRIYPADSTKAAQSLRYLGVTLTHQQRYVEAAQQLQASVDTYARIADDDAQRYRALADLATVKLSTGDAAGAEPLLREAVANIERLVGGESYDVRTPLKRLGQALLAEGRLDEAQATLERVLALEIKLFGNDQHRDVCATRFALAETGLARGTVTSLAQAQALIGPLLEMRRRKPAVDDVPSVLLLSARIALAQGDPARAQADIVAAADVAPADSVEVQRQRRLLQAEAGRAPPALRATIERLATAAP